MYFVYVLNGPNINMLELRPQEHYHTGVAPEQDNDSSPRVITYQDLCHTVVQEGAGLGLEVEVWQSNSESEMVDKLQIIARSIKATPAPPLGACAGVIINAGAYTHTSIAIRDALELIPRSVPVVEVHLSNIYAREGFRHRSYLSSICHGVIAGLGVYSYVAALGYIASYHRNNKQQ